MFNLNEAALRLRDELGNPGNTVEELQMWLDEALEAERRLEHQCDGYAGDAGASAPRCERYKGHPGRHRIFLEGVNAS